MPGIYEDNIFYVNEFDEAMENQIIIPLAAEIEKQAELKKGRIDLHVNSVGGYLYSMNHMVELIELAKRNDVIVRTIVPYMAYSCGSMVAIAGTPGYRYIGRRAEHLVHYGQQMSFETTEEQIDRFTAHKKRVFKQNFDHYQKYCDIPGLSDKMLDDGYFVPAAKAIKYGMADKYLDKMPLDY